MKTPWTRRRLLGTGLAGLVGSALPLRVARAASEQVLVIYWARGGWDSTFVFDPHPDSETIQGDPFAEIREEGGLSWAHADSRPTVSSFLSNWASQACIINGIGLGSISHEKCTRIMLTGTRVGGAADLPTLLGAASRGDYALPSVLLSGPRYPGSLGASSVALNQTLLGTATGELPVDRSYDLDAEELIRSYLAEEARLREDARPQVSDYALGLSQLEELESVAPHLEISDGAGFSELLDAGLQGLGRGLCRVVLIEGTTPDLAQWDSHSGNQDLQDRCFEHAFGELTEIMDGLSSTSAPGGGVLADGAMVLAMSEMGRTPVTNGSQGKDHWPFTSMLAVGSGVRGGQVVGLTDDTLVGQPLDLQTGAGDESGSSLTPAHVVAGVLSAFGVDTTDSLPGIEPLSAAFGTD